MTSKTAILPLGRGRTAIRLWRSLLAHAAAAHERSRQRHVLASLNDSLLADIGLTRRDVMAETSKPFWRA